MLRIHFTAEDLLRTTLAPGPAPLMELGLAIATWQRQDALFDRWRRRVGPALPPAATPLLQLVPPTGAGPEFLDPLSMGLEDGLALVQSVPTDQLRPELRRICDEGRPVTSWIRALDGRDRDAWLTLDEAMRAAHDVLVAPSWQRIEAAYRAEVARCSRVIATNGLRAMLSDVYPGSTWRGSTLEIPVESQLDLRPDGHGVRLLPSIFWTGRPLIGLPLDSSLLIVYAPAVPLPLAADDAADGSLASLLGGTRAAVLASTRAGCTTTGLARELGISAASASEHARVLRAAGLVNTAREGKAVRHTVTALGERLLQAV